MKRIAFLFILLSQIVSGQNYTIGNWYNFKKGAISLTFITGNTSTIDIGIPEMNSRDLVGTFYMGDLWDKSWAILANEKGHEIGNHTKSHQSLPSLTGDELFQEITVFNQELENDLGFPIKTFIYPYGHGGQSDSAMYHIQDSIAQSHISASSIQKPTDQSHYSYDFAKSDRDYFQLKTVHMSDSMRTYHEDFRNVINMGGYMTYLFQTIGIPGGWENMDVDHFKDVLDDLVLIKDSVWLATVKDAICYHRERKTANLTTVYSPFENGNSWVLNLTDSLRNDWFDHPLSIKLKKPSEVVTILSLKQGSEVLDFTVFNDSVIFNAIPDNGDIIFEILNCEIPIVDLSILDDSIICTPDSAKLEVNYNSSYNYSWFKDSVQLQVDSNIFFAKEAGVYFSEVKLNGCPIQTRSVEILIKGICGIPKANFIANKKSEFLDEEISFTSTSTNLEGTETYFWEFGEGASRSDGFYGPGPVDVSYSKSGKKDVKLTVTGSLSSTDTIKSQIVEIANINSCGIYREDFNGPDYKFWYGCYCKFGFNYKIDLLNKVLRLNLTDSLIGEWDGFNLYFYKDTVIKTLDFSNELYKPVLRVRAKASDTCRASFALLDSNGVSVAGTKLQQKNYIDLTTEYQEFELDFSGLFKNQWNNNELVDSTAALCITMSINHGFESYPFWNNFGQRINQNFVGNVDIDWISLGEKCQFDSLKANIVLPDTVCEGEFFNCWNYSKPKLKNATYKWSFGRTASVLDTIMADEMPISISYSDTGAKYITLNILEENGDTASVTERVFVESCLNGIYEINDELNFKFTNPFNGVINGVINSKSSLDAVLFLSDINGRLIKSRNIYINKGENSVVMSNVDLQSGVYVLTIFTEHTRHEVKLISTK